MATKTTTRPKSMELDYTTLDSVGRSYYAYCLETALDAIRHARMLVADDVTDENHELPTIELLLVEALEVT